MPKGKYNRKHPAWNKGKKGGTPGSFTSNTFTRDFLSNKMMGDKNPNWKGGVSKESDIIRKSIEYKLWRQAVFERDQFTCVWCGHKSNGLRPSDIHPDHIKPFADYPELRFAIDNGRTLCIPCHKTTDTWGFRKNKK